MKAKIWIAAVLALACLTANGAAVQSTMQVSFVLADVCAVQGPPTSMPTVSCQNRSPYLLSKNPAIAPAGAAPGGTWTVYF